MLDDRAKPVLSYATPEPVQSAGGKLALNIATVSVVALGFLLIMNLPNGDWHFSHNPQWHLNADVRGVSIGHSGAESFYIGTVPLHFIKLLIASVPAWLVRRRFDRKPNVKNQSSDFR